MLVKGIWMNLGEVERKSDALNISEWVQLCNDLSGTNLKTVRVEGYLQRAYFCFRDYDYYLDVSKQMVLMPDVKPLVEGLQESYEWLRQNRGAVIHRPYMEYIDTMVTS